MRVDAVPSIELDAGENARRPGVTILLPCALIFWAVCAAFYVTYEDNEYPVSMLLAACFICMLAAGILSLAIRRVRIICALALSCLLGIVVALLGAAHMLSSAQAAYEDEGTWVFTLTEDARASSFGSTAFASAEGPRKEHLNVLLSFSESSALLRGDSIVSQARLHAPRDREREYCWQRGCAACAAVGEWEAIESPAPLEYLLDMRRRAIERLGAYGGNQAGLLQAIACGYRNTLFDSPLYESCKICGVAHLVAVSGAHLAIVMALFSWLLELTPLPRIARFILLSTGALCYLVFAGVPISAIRAAIMTLLALASPLAQRRSAPIQALSLCVFGIIATDVSASVSVSFVLSALSTLGIVLFASLFSSWFSKAPVLVRRILVEPSALTLSSNIATLPFSCSLFSQLSLIAPLANVIVAPLFTLCCATSLIAALASCFTDSVAFVFCCAASIAAWPLQTAIQAMAQIPYACIAVVTQTIPMLALSAVLCAFLWIVWPRPSRKGIAVAGAVGCAAVAALCMGSPASNDPELIMLDVGQGDSFLLRSEGHAFLIDTGNHDALLREDLGRLGVRRLDGVCITHPDDDHCASLDSLAGYVEIGALYAARDMLGCPCERCADLRDMAKTQLHREFIPLSAGDEFSVGKFRMHVTWPHAYACEGGNADSLCMRAELDCDDDGTCDWRMLFTGDAEAEQLEQMIEEGEVGDIDILKVGHHGSRVSLTPAIAETLKPEVALISCGENNRYGHPSEEVLECLCEVEHILRTDESGRVMLKFNAHTIQTIPEK